MTRRWDDFLVSDEGHLHRLLVGRTVTFGGDERHEERTITIARVKWATVGLDAAGIWSSVTVITTDGDEFAFYDGGTVVDKDDNVVGHAKLYNDAGLKVAS